MGSHVSEKCTRLLSVTSGLNFTQNQRFEFAAAAAAGAREFRILAENLQRKGAELEAAIQRARLKDTRSKL
jgi:hypothetical protein